MNISDSFILGLQNISHSVLPKRVVEKVRMCFLDYLACAIGGAKGLQDSAMRNLLIDEKGQGSNHVIGWDGLFPTAIAALINGFSAHYLELDDGHRKGAIHIGSPIFSALLAVSEKENISCEDFIRGSVAGYEAAARLACAVQPGCRQRGYHATGICGTVGAVVGVAIALHFSKVQLKTAISAAVAGAAGVLEMQEDASDLKPYNVGRAAMDAVMAACVGKAGFHGPDDPIGGKRGYLKVMTDIPQLDYLTDFSSDTLQIEQTYLKIYAACRHAHPAIEAILALRKKIGKGEITGIKVLTYKQATEGHNHKVIPTVASAKMSIPFSVASALMIGSAGIEAFTDSTIHDDRVLNLMQHVTVDADKELTALCPQKRVAIVEAITTNATYTHRVDFPKGEPENPLSREEVENKFRLLSHYAGMDSIGSDLIIKEVWENDFSLRRILSLLSV